MKRSKLKNLFNKSKIQRNYYINLLCKTKQYCKNLDIKEVTDNKKIWKGVKSHFGKGDSNSGKIMVFENNLIKTNEKEITTIMNNFLLTLPKI